MLTKLRLKRGDAFLLDNRLVAGCGLGILGYFGICGASKYPLKTEGFIKEQASYSHKRPARSLGATAVSNLSLMDLHAHCFSPLRSVVSLIISNRSTKDKHRLTSKWRLRLRERKMECEQL